MIFVFVVNSKNISIQNKYLIANMIRGQAVDTLNDGPLVCLPSASRFPIFYLAKLHLPERDSSLKNEN